MSLSDDGVENQCECVRERIGHDFPVRITPITQRDITVMRVSVNVPHNTKRDMQQSTAMEGAGVRDWKYEKEVIIKQKNK